MKDRLDNFWLVKGRPYDTMEEVIGLRGTAGHGSLREWGVSYDELPLAEDGSISWDDLPHALKSGKPGDWMSAAKAGADATETLQDLLVLAGLAMACACSVIMLCQM